VSEFVCFLVSLTTRLFAFTKDADLGDNIEAMYLALTAYFERCLWKRYEGEEGRK
jgi:hypothetical protein